MMPEKKKKMDANYKNAKMGLLKDLHKMASDAMANDMKGMKKVSVMSDDEEGLKEGLDKAKDMVEKMPEAEHMMADGEMMKDEDMKEESEEDPLAECSPEELDEMIKELQAKKMEMMKK